MFRGTHEQPVELDGVIYLFNSTLADIDPFQGDGPVSQLGYRLLPVWTREFHGLLRSLSTVIKQIDFLERE